MKVDTVIVGAGSAGLSALCEVRRYTDDFLLVNDGHWGTTCAAVGCMPSKALIEAANAFHRRGARADQIYPTARRYAKLRSIDALSAHSRGRQRP